jgi:tetratricopeptide (TPR) repeat protein
MRLAEALGLPSEEFERRFDGTPGSLILNLEGMRNRYEALRDEQVGGVPMNRLLDSAKVLHKGGQARLTDGALRMVAERVRGEGRIGADVWEALRRRSQEDGFGQFDANRSFQVYRPYLEQCVLYEPSEEDMEGLLSALAELEDAEGLVLLGTSYVPDANRSGMALLCFGRALEIDRDQYLGWQGKAVTLAAINHNHEAVEAYEEVLRLRPDMSGVWVSKAMVLNELGRHEEALASSEQALELDPQLDHGWMTKGISLASLDLIPEALEAYDKAIEINPKFAAAWLNRGLALDALGDHEQAMQAYDVALSLRPGYGLAYHNKGNLLGEAGLHEEALECYERALEYESGYTHEDWLGKGIALRHLGRFDEALRAIDNALTLDPEFVSAWHSRGIVLDQLGRHDEALEAVDKAISLDSSVQQLWRSRGIVLFNLGRLEEALGAFDEAIRSEWPVTPALLRSRAAVLRGLGRHRDALQAVYKSIRLGTDLPESWHLRSELLDDMGLLRKPSGMLVDASGLAVWRASRNLGT